MSSSHHEPYEAVSTEVSIGTTLAGVITRWDKAAEALFGYSAEQAIGAHLADLLVAPALLEQRVCARTAELGTARHSPANTVLAHDLTERSESRTSLTTTQRETEALFSVIHKHAIVSVADRTGRITDVNDAFCAISGYSREELLGQDHQIINSEFHNSAFWLEMWRTIGSGKPWRAEICNRAKDGALYWVDSIIAPFLDDSNKPAKYMSIRFDITAAKHAASELVSLNRLLAERSAQAESANTAKSMFLANLSHEIRTPLNAVIGLTYLLEQSTLDAGQAGLVGKVKLASRSLLGVINDVLDLSKIEAGEMAIEDVPFNLISLLNELISVMMVHASNKSIQLAMELDAEVPRMLRGDAGLLQQILTNLLSNAIKFTEQGSVLLMVNALEHTGNRLLLRFVVRDTGMGIEPEVQKRLFAPFTQADVSTTRRFGGTGLGLSIVKRLAILMDGDVMLTSTPGVGTEFVVKLPFWVESQHAGTSAPPRPLEVLIACDALHDRTKFSNMARALGWRVESLEPGRPLMESVLERLATARPVEVVVFTGSAADPHGAQTLMALGAAAVHERMPTAVFVKARDAETLAATTRPAMLDVIVVSEPVTTSALFDAVQQSAVAEARASDKAQGVAGERLQGKRILIVDDSPINLEVAQRILQLEGAHVTLATNGQEAVDLLRMAPLAYDAILMDVQMPVLDGIEATRLMRGQLGLKFLPIIALTAGALLSERERAGAAGMDDFISKPFEPHSMIGKLRKRLLQPDEAEPVANPRVARTSSIPSAWPAIDGLNRTETCARFSGDKELLANMLRRLRDEFADLTVPGVGLDNPDQLAARMHRLVGSAGTVGATALSHAARCAEQALRHGGGEGLQAVSETLAQELQTLFASVALQLVPATLPPLALAETAEASSLYDRSQPDAALAELIALLQEQSIEALDVFANLTPALQSRFGDAGFAALRTALDTLEYKSALRILLRT